MKVAGYPIMTVEDFEDKYKLTGTKIKLNKLKITIEDIFEEINDDDLMDGTFTFQNTEHINQKVLGKKLQIWENIILQLQYYILHSNINDDDDDDDDDDKKKPRESTYSYDYNGIKNTSMHRAVVNVCKKSSSQPYYSKFKILLVMVEYYLPYSQLRAEHKIIAKEKNKKYLMENVECECGVITGRSNLPKHRKTLKHQTLLVKKIAAGEYIPKPDEENQDCDDEE